MLACLLRCELCCLRYAEMFVGLGVLVALGRYLDINHTAVALLFLITVLFASAYWGLRYAVVLSFAATAAFNFFFLPPLYTFTIADPQNWIALAGLSGDRAGRRQSFRTGPARGRGCQAAAAGSRTAVCVQPAGC